MRLIIHGGGVNKAYDRCLSTRLGLIVDNSPGIGIHAINIYSPGSDKLNEVLLYMSTSCQPGSREIRAFSDVEQLFFIFLPSLSRRLRGSF